MPVLNLHLPGLSVNERSPDQRRWASSKVLPVNRRRSLLTVSRVARSRCPVEACPSWALGAPTRLHQPDTVTRPRTLDDFPMQHTRSDALEMLHHRRLEEEARRQSLRSDGGEFRRVSTYSRRRFDSAVSSHGEGPQPSTSPDEAALFYKVATPSWSKPTCNATGFKPRPHSVSSASRPPSSPPAQVSANTAAASGKTRPDSEPPYFSPRYPLDGQRQARTFNHMRRQRQLYPEIHRLVQRYNNDLRVVHQPPGQSSLNTKPSSLTEYSVTSGFLLVPLKQGEEEEDNLPEHAQKGDEQAEINVEPPCLEDAESVELLQQENKTEDQLSGRRESDGRGHRQSAIGGQEEPINDDEEEEVEGATLSPWRCWVDDATVSTVHSRAPSVASREDWDGGAEDGPHRPALEEVNIGAKATLANQVTSKAHLSKGEQVKSNEPGATSAPGKTPSPASDKRDNKKGGRGKKKDSAPPELPPPPPQAPVEEPPLIVEELVEAEAEAERAEPEPEPVPPSYICPSSESKSHAAEIRRWLGQSRFTAASRTMPIY